MKIIELIGKKAFSKEIIKFWGEKWIVANIVRYGYVKGYSEMFQNVRYSETHGCYIDNGYCKRKLLVYSLKEKDIEFCKRKSFMFVYPDEENPYPDYLIYENDDEPDELCIYDSVGQKIKKGDIVAYKNYVSGFHTCKVLKICVCGHEKNGIVIEIENCNSDYTNKYFYSKDGRFEDLICIRNNE